MTQNGCTTTGYSHFITVSFSPDPQQQPVSAVGDGGVGGLGLGLSLSLPDVLYLTGLADLYSANHNPSLVLTGCCSINKDRIGVQLYGMLQLSLVPVLSFVMRTPFDLENLISYVVTSRVSHSGSGQNPFQLAAQPSITAAWNQGTHGVKVRVCVCV